LLFAVSKLTADKISSDTGAWKSNSFGVDGIVLMRAHMFAKGLLTLGMALRCRALVSSRKRAFIV
jgi:hypothetical protein